MYSDDDMNEDVQPVQQNGKRPIKAITESDSENQQSADDNCSGDVNLNDNERISRTDATETPMSDRQQQKEAPQQRKKRKKKIIDDEQCGNFELYV